MSSKSRKHKPSPQAPKHHGGAHTKVADPGPVESHSPSDPDELLVAPKGTSRFKFYVSMAIIVFTLITFVVPFALTGMFQADRGGEWVVRWEHPTEGTQVLTHQRLIAEKRALEVLFGMLAGSSPGLSDEQVAAFVIYDQLALDEGVAVPHDDFVAQVGSFVQRAGGLDEYRQALRQYNSKPLNFENTLRRMMRATRYQAMLAMVAAQPDLEEVERLYSEAHREYLVEYVEAPVDDFTDAAREQAPAGEELKAWFDALPEPDKARFKTQARATAELAGVFLGDDMVPPAGLLERYPPPDDLDPKRYYDQVNFTRFQLDEPTETGEFYAQYEDVQEVVAREAPVHHALQAWRADLAERLAAGAEIDLGAEAAELGVRYLPPDEPKTRSQWADKYLAEAATDEDATDEDATDEDATDEDATDEDATDQDATDEDAATDESEPSDAVANEWGNLYVAGQVFNAQENTFFTIVAHRDAMVFGRTTAKQPAELPPFDQIEDEARELWVERQRADLALAAFEALRDGFGERLEGDDLFLPTADAETFAAAAQAAGYEVLTLDWFDRSKPIRPQLDNGEPDPHIDARRFAVGRSAFYTEDAEVGLVAPAGLSGLRTKVFVARLAGEREGDVAKLGPADHERFVAQSAYESWIEFITEVMVPLVPRNVEPEEEGRNELVELFGLEFKQPEPEEGE